jgi:hypothetical protein
VDESRGILSAELEHLSWVGAFGAGLEALDAPVRAALLPFLRFQGGRAEPPTCGGTAPTGVRREPPPDNFNDPVLACVVTDSDGARVTLVNNRAYPLVIGAAAGQPTLVEPPDLGPTDTVIRAAAPLPGRSVYLPAKGKATFALAAPLPGEFGFTGIMTRFTFVATLMEKLLDRLLAQVATKYVKNPSPMREQLALVFQDVGMNCLRAQLDLVTPATKASQIWTMIKACMHAVAAAAEMVNPAFKKFDKAQRKFFELVSCNGSGHR